MSGIATHGAHRRCAASTCAAESRALVPDGEEPAIVTRHGGGAARLFVGGLIELPLPLGRRCDEEGRHDDEPGRDARPSALGRDDFAWRSGLRIRLVSIAQFLSTRLAEATVMLGGLLASVLAC